MKAVLLVIALVLVSGCIWQGELSKRAMIGDTVSVYYTLKVDNTTVDTNVGKTPLTFKVGSGEMIKGFEIGVIGMAAGEERTFPVSPENGYGTSGSHPLAGKTLVFTVKMVSVTKEK